ERGGRPRAWRRARRSRWRASRNPPRRRSGSGTGSPPGRARMPNRATSDPVRPPAEGGPAEPDRRAAPAGAPVRLYGVVLASLGGDGLPDGLPDDLALTPYRSIAGLTRPAPTDQARRVREYLLGYAEVLDRVAGAAPV